MATSQTWQDSLSMLVEFENLLCSPHFSQISQGCVLASLQLIKKVREHLQIPLLAVMCRFKQLHF